MNIIEFIQKNDNDGRLIIGIDGLSRSGKTTYAKQLEKELSALSYSVVVLHIDDFITCRSDRYHTKFEEWYEYYYLQWNSIELKNKLFNKIKSASVLQLPYYISTLDRRIQKNVSIRHADIIMIEGVFLQRPQWRDSFDFVVYIESTRSARFNRENDETKKDIEKFKERYWKAEDYYIHNINPAKKANVIISNL
ncbi:kinase [Cytobacillus gottheilii]|uniref:kinase n=1 Tax=Cytobacillus gottheilii TaxID=859144 RepID=UPI00214851FE|nr:kinase [Cytobacillus gottheilii]